MKNDDFGPLSKNEQSVLYYLVRYPDLSDKEVQARIDMKQSTYSTIKKKLWNEGYYYTSYTPMLNNLGSELMVVWYVTMNRKTNPEERLAITRNKLVAAADIFTIVSESHQAVMLSISKNMAEHTRISDRLVHLYEVHDFLEDISYVYFPFEVSALISFFDFAPLLNRIFKIEPMENFNEEMRGSPKSQKAGVRHVELNELERNVYSGLVRFPELSDSALAEKIGCSRQVFTRLKNRFLMEGQLRKQRMISLEKLGFRVLSMTHSQYNPRKPMRSRQICSERVDTLLTPFFNVSRDPESVTLAAFRSYEEYKSYHSDYVGFCTEAETLKGEPLTVVLSIPRIFEVKWLVFDALVRKALGD